MRGMMLLVRITCDIKKQIDNLRINLDKEHEEWFKEPQGMAEKVGMEIKIPRITGRLRILLPLTTTVSTITPQNLLTIKF